MATTFVGPSDAAEPVRAMTDFGRWLTESGNLEVDIGQCTTQPTDTTLCGTVTRVLSDRSMSNPKVAMKDSQPILGKQLLSGFVESGANEWQGKIFNRENGKTYDCRIKRLTPDRIEVKPYIFLPIIGSAQVWSRIEKPKSSP
ncbi:MAG TPA: DUF2147 domain-containing protein [Steroidobacteraceae bacterium]|nr:DUF2147 domain-containing protein [Steroidobacteraceae bacterium]